MKFTRNIYRFALLSVILFTAACTNRTSTETKQDNPNILIILADDMGYGDTGCYNPESKIPTPNIDKLAVSGMRFTDAHSAGSTCTPSRYGLLTGQYPTRNSRNYKEGLIEPGKLTIASLLKNSGYKTACIGKWHQGMIDEKNPQPGVKLIGGPNDHGFDYFFGLPASLDIPPYYYVENSMSVLSPSDSIGASNTPGISPIQGAFWRAGKIAPGYEHKNVVDELAEKAEEHIENHFTDNSQQLFLYFTLPSPHTPWLPNDEFKGSTAVGDYGDYVAQVDGVVGRLLRKFKELDQANNTLVIFTSDNGPVWYPEDVDKYGHNSTGKLRGMKGDAWEGGHRMPFIVNWHEKIEPNTVTDQLTCFTDLLATFAEITGQKIPEKSDTDSYSFLHQLTGQESEFPERENLVLKGSRKNSYFIKSGDWKFIDYPSSGGFSEGYMKSNGIEIGDTPKQLYNLTKDIGETENLYNTYRKKADELSNQLNEIISNEKN